MALFAKVAKPDVVATLLRPYLLLLLRRQRGLSPNWPSPYRRQSPFQNAWRAWIISDSCRRRIWRHMSGRAQVKRWLQLAETSRFAAPGAARLNIQGEREPPQRRQRPKPTGRVGRRRMLYLLHLPRMSPHPHSCWRSSEWQRPVV